MTHHTVFTDPLQKDRAAEDDDVGVGAPGIPEVSVYLLLSLLSTSAIVSEYLLPSLLPCYPL